MLAGRLTMAAPEFRQIFLPFPVRRPVVENRHSLSYSFKHPLTIYKSICHLMHFIHTICLSITSSDKRERMLHGRSDTRLQCHELERERERACAHLIICFFHVELSVLGV